MALELRQQLKLSQQLVMTPQLQQAIRLLQLSRVDLLETVQQELMENPFLEESAPQPEAPAPSEQEDRPSDIREDAAYDGELARNADWEDYLGEFASTPKGSQSQEFDVGDDMTPFEGRYAEKPSLDGHLRWQLRLSSLTERQQEIGEAIIGNLSSVGYLQASVDELAAMTQATPDEVRAVLERVQQAIDSRAYDSAQPCFTPEGYTVYQKLVHNGQAVICGQPDYRFVPCARGVMARSLPMRFTFSNRRSFVEQVVFEIDTVARKISNLSFALSENMVRSILGHEQWNERSRLAIIDFIETYQTAYALKRLDYLQSIFSEDALIIVGKVLAPATHLEGQYIPPRVRQNRLSKATYMRNLKACFDTQEYINLKFADINIVRAGKGGEIYGIQMQQDYFSTTYGDKGYLFLHVDLNNPDQPIIHVRTWQPASAVGSADDVINISDFNLE